MSRPKRRSPLYDKEPKPTIFIIDKPPHPWHPLTILPFVIENIEYQCVEQYIMAQKALLFGDHDTYDKIMRTTDNIELLRLGKNIHNYDHHEWEQHRMDVVDEAYYFKTLQNRHLCDELLASGNVPIIYAHPKDLTWGVGVSSRDPDVTNAEKWKGRNILGKALMHVRDLIRDRERNVQTPDNTEPDADDTRKRTKQI